MKTTMFRREHEAQIDYYVRLQESIDFKKKGANEKMG